MGGGGVGGGVDHADERNGDSCLDLALESVGGVAGDDEEISAALLQAAGGFGELGAGRWAAASDGGVAVGDARIVVDEDALVILVALGRRGGDEFGEEIDASGWTHAANDADGFGHERSTS